MTYPKIPLAQSIIEICRLKGVTDIVISPGSRNAPLTIGFAANPFFNCYSIADERCAAFFGMGMAQQLRRPVALVCTSGSALLNYYPAIAEAFYSQIPIIVISADRPHDKIDIGDGQTIRQENVYANHILYNANLFEEVSAENDEKIIKAIDVATLQKGPVHINAPFEEPLYNTVDELSIKAPAIQQPVTLNSTKIDNSFYERWNNDAKKLILVGVDYPDELDASVIERLAADPSVVVMTETTSNLHNQNFLNSIDTIITPFTQNDFEAWRPDILLTFGGMVVSKRVKAWLRNYKPKEHWHVDPFRAYDTYGALTAHIKTSPNSFFKQLFTESSIKESGYSQMAANIKTYRKIKHDAYLSTIPFSDLKVFEMLFKQLPDNIQLQLSNSSTIRYAQLFDVKPSVEVFCNRGTSGIDGCTSTAVGAACAANKPVLLITGDISFFYDSNALWNNYIPTNFKILLLNNGGGGIFRILPGHKETPLFNKYFETEHHLTAEYLAKTFGLGYRTANNEEQLNAQWAAFLNDNTQPQILEVFTPIRENDTVLREYFKALT